jgi:ketol-acid reductoisomerase
VSARLRYVHRADADPAALDGLTVAIIGYGNLGRSLAANLRDSGVRTIVGNRDDAYSGRAAADGFAPRSIAEAAATADLAWILVPDEEIAACCAEHVWPALPDGAAACFASGYALAFEPMRPPDGADLLLCAPRMPGDEVRGAYLDRSGFVTYLNAERDASGRAWPRLLALAAAAGGLERGAVVVPAHMEATVDLFVEQTMGATLGAAMQLAFEVGVAEELPEELLVLELYQSGELARTAAGFARDGFYRASAAHGATALFGGFTRLQELDVAGLREGYRRALADITSGGFARAFAAERDAGGPILGLIRSMVSGEDPQSRAEDRARRGLSGADPGS